VGESLRQAQDDPGSENIPLAAGLGLHNALEFSLLALGHFNRYRCWHNRHPTKSIPTIQSLLWDTRLASFLAFEQLTALIEQIAQLVYDRRYLIKLLSFYRFVWQVKDARTLRFVNYWLRMRGTSLLRFDKASRVEELRLA
jgi:hypothetical protein